MIILNGGDLQLVYITRTLRPMSSLNYSFIGPSIRAPLRGRCTASLLNNVPACAENEGDRKPPF